MEGQLSSNTFLKVFTLSVVPNALFDLAGLICGSTDDVSLSTFLSAVWIAKALVRTPAQTCSLALAVALVSSSPDDSSSSSTSHDPTGLYATIQRYGRKALLQFVHTDTGGGEDTTYSSSMENNDDDDRLFGIFLSLVQASWKCLTVLMLGFFFVTTVEQVAQRHQKSKQRRI